MQNAKIQSLVKTDLVTVHYGESLGNAFALLKTNGIRHLPVVNAVGEIIGILSDRDLLRASVSTTDSEGRPNAGMRFIEGAHVMDYMSTALRTIDLNASVQEAVDLMLREKISSCLVVQGEQVVGIITYEDLLGMLKDYLNGSAPGLRTTIAGFIARSPLGSIAQSLANVGI